MTRPSQTCLKCDTPLRLSDPAGQTCVAPALDGSPLQMHGCCPGCGLHFAVTVRLVPVAARLIPA